MRVNKENLSLFMAQREMTLSQLAEKSNLSRFTLSRINSGYEVTPITVGKIANAIGTSVESLIIKSE